VLTVATFLTPGGGNDFFTVGYAAVTFVLVGLAYSLVNVPYGAAMAMSTRDSGMRMKLAGMRSFGVGIGIIIVSTFTQPLIEFVGGSTTSKFGFAVVIGLYSAVGLVLFWVVSRWVKERVPATPVTKAKGNLGASLRALAGNLPWLAVVAFSILAFARLGVITGGAVYFAIYALGNPGAIPIVLFAFSLSAVVGSLLTAPILKWLGQRRAVIIGLVISIAFTPVLYLVKDDLLLFAIAFFLANIVGGFGFVAAPAFIADTVEWQEARAGRRDEGLLFAGYSMSTKIGAALGSALLAWGLAAIGYTPGVVNESAANGVLWLFLGLPVIISVLQIVAISCYRLEGRLATVKEQARARREETLRHGQDQ
jgi:GPH family glycoside/pentoside/hexuronide:cation symporter